MAKTIPTEIQILLFDYPKGFNCMVIRKSNKI